jgi:hypothetical protein
MAIVEMVQELDMPKRHRLMASADVAPRHLEKVLLSAYENPPEDVERYWVSRACGRRRYVRWRSWRTRQRNTGLDAPPGLLRLRP